MRDVYDSKKGENSIKEEPTPEQKKE